MEENDIETHYQLSLLYLTMLETTLIQSIDNIQSPLAVTSIQYLQSMICSGERAIPQQQPQQQKQDDDDDDDDEDENNVNINYYDYPIGRGIYCRGIHNVLRFMIYVHVIYKSQWIHVLN